MKRIILYYPTINIRNTSWIKQAILYWDEIGSIIPRNLDNPNEMEQNIRILRAHNAFRSYYPDDYVKDSHELIDEFVAICNSRRFHQTVNGSPMCHGRFKIYIGKMHRDLVDWVVQEGIGTLEGEWLYLPYQESMLYMSLLAKYLSDNAYGDVVVPGTDWLGYQQLSFSVRTTHLKPALSMQLYQALPVPREDTPLEKILEFKEHRHDELILFRQILLDYQDKAKTATTVAELNNVVKGFSEKMEVETNKINRIGEDEKLPFVLGTADIILSIGVPGLLAILFPTLSPVLAVAAVGMHGAIKLAKMSIDERNRQRRTLEENEFAYLYYAHQAGIIP